MTWALASRQRARLPPLGIWASPPKQRHGRLCVRSQQTSTVCGKSAPHREITTKRDPKRLTSDPSDASSAAVARCHRTARPSIANHMAEILALVSYNTSKPVKVHWYDLTVSEPTNHTLYHGHPCPSFWLGPELSLGIARLSLRQEGRTRVEALVEGDQTTLYPWAVLLAALLLILLSRPNSASHQDVPLLAEVRSLVVAIGTRTTHPIGYEGPCDQTQHLHCPTPHRENDYTCPCEPFNLATTQPNMPDYCSGYGWLRLMIIMIRSDHWNRCSNHPLPRLPRSTITPTASTSRRLFTSGGCLRRDEKACWMPLVVNW